MNDNRHTTFRNGACLSNLDSLTDRELAWLADKEHQAVQKERRQAARRERRNGALTVTATATAALAGHGALTATVRRKRRGNGRGSVYYRNHGGYQYWVAAVQSRTGGQRKTWYRYAKTEAEAVVKLQELQMAIGVVRLAKTPAVPLRSPTPDL